MSNGYKYILLKCVCIRTTLKVFRGYNIDLYILKYNRLRYYLKIFKKFEIVIHKNK